jgi:pilus assembly protein CpaC
MGSFTVIRRFCIVSAVVLGFCQIFIFECWGEGPSRITLETTSAQKVSLTVGKSIIIRSPGPVKRISLAVGAQSKDSRGAQAQEAPEIADAIPVTPYQIYLYGKAPGITNLTLWGMDDSLTILDLEISPDISRLKEVLYKILPEEKDIKVTATHDNITLSGTVSSVASLSRVLALAEPYFPGTEKTGKVVNLLEVAGVHQVMLEVRVAEMSRSLVRRLGFNFSYVSGSGNNIGLSLLNSLTKLPSGGFPTNPLGVSSNINSLFRFISHDTSWTTFIDALKEEGLLKVLAEPTLITLSGKTANFLAGGEFPVPVPQPSGVGTTITIQYKPFGVALNFTPTVLSSKKISMQVAPEVSDLDFSNAITISGFVVPALTTRRVSTAIELADGQSFAIAGLLRDNVREVISKFPVLGEIPVLGSLFRSSSFQRNETELIVIATPHLVKPVDAARQTLPTDQYFEPDDFEFYLLGNLEGRGGINPLKGSGLEGNFGHIIPK